MITNPLWRSTTSAKTATVWFEIGDSDDSFKVSADLPLRVVVVGLFLLLRTVYLFI